MNKCMYVSSNRDLIFAALDVYANMQTTTLNTLTKMTITTTSGFGHAVNDNFKTLFAKSRLIYS